MGGCWDTENESLNNWECSKHAAAVLSNKGVGTANQWERSTATQQPITRPCYLLSGCGWPWCICCPGVVELVRSNLGTSFPLFHVSIRPTLHALPLSMWCNVVTQHVTLSRLSGPVHIITISAGYQNIGPHNITILRCSPALTAWSMDQQARTVLLRLQFS